MMGTLGWECSRCTFYHHAPGARCVMCNELRVTKQQMLDFIQGKPVSETNTAGERAASIRNPYNKKKKLNSSHLPSNQSIPWEVQSKTTEELAKAVGSHPFPKQSSRDELNARSSKHVHSKALGAFLHHELSNPFAANSKAVLYEPGPVPLCEQTAEVWIYPVHNDFPLREYQKQISETAIFANTLVSLPTGLGKTLIAAVVLYNYYRWFPLGKIVFMAPTLPLVNQQVKACYDIMGIPAEDTAILTGKVKADDRSKLWNERRVFFCTPQTVQKDLELERCHAKQLVCLVLDEAHKASGEYAYTQVVNLLERGGAKYRLVGLSATPGTNIKAIQRVVDALRINRIEARFEDDRDVKKYMHERHSEIIVVKNSTVASSVERKLNNLIGPLLDELRQSGALTRVSGNATVVPYSIIRAREEYAKSNGSDHRMMAYFAAAQKFVQCRADLRTHGIGVLRNRLVRLKSEPQRGVLATIIKCDDFQALWEEIATSSFDPDSSLLAAVDRKINNPKLLKLDEILTEHFERSRACNESSRAIIFSQWRESVSEIVEVLSMSQPLLRPRHFVGQGSVNRAARGKKALAQSGNATRGGMKQAEQQQVIREFREGIYNVLVCTCIGEEGLDIGDVDLIVNYDTLRSPIRMIQRTGRTGRKRDGRVVCLVSEGHEEKTFKQSKEAEATLGRALKNSFAFKLYPNSPMFPQMPRCLEKDMSIQPGFHLSQVGGHARSAKQLRGGLDYLAAGEQHGCWQLSAEQERIRAEQLGVIGQLPAASLLAAFPRSALRNFLGQRSFSLSTIDSRRDGVGLTSLILNEVEIKYSYKDRRVSPSKGRTVDVARRLSSDCFPLLYFSDDNSEKLVFPTAPDQNCFTPAQLCTSVNFAVNQGVAYGEAGFCGGVTDVVPPNGSSLTVSASTAEFKLKTPPESSDESENDSHCDWKDLRNSDGCFLSDKARNHSTELNISTADTFVNGLKTSYDVRLLSSPIMQIPSQDESSEDESASDNSLAGRVKGATLHHDGNLEKENRPFCSNRRDDLDKNTLPEHAKPNRKAPKKRITAILSPECQVGSAGFERGEPAHLRSQWNNDTADTFSFELVDTPDSQVRKNVAIHHSSSLTSLNQAEDSFVCAICLSSDFEEGNPIIFCDGLPGAGDSCSLATHLSCYSIPSDCINMTSWQCDLCKWKTEANNSLPSCPIQPKCDFCRHGEGPLTLTSKGSWHHPYCSDWSKVFSEGKCDFCAVAGSVKCKTVGCNASAHPHCAISSPRSAWLMVREASGQSFNSTFAFSMFCPSHVPNGLNKSGENRRKRIIFRQSTDLTGNGGNFVTSLPVAADHFEMEESRRRKFCTHDLEETDSARYDRRVKRKRMVMRSETRKTSDCYIEDEALIDTDEDVDGDEDESELARIDQEEAIFAESFINDSSQLGFSEDELDAVDPDCRISNHRDLDAAREEADLFATPRLNRRMLRSNDSSGRRSSSSDPGLGKMHFIRSVLEHLRQGGDADDIEDFYQQAGEETDDENELHASGIQNIKPAVLKYVASSDSEDDS